MQTGRLVVISKTGDYGFIRPDVGNTNVLLHKERISPDLPSDEFRAMCGNRFLYEYVTNANKKNEGKLMATFARRLPTRECPIGILKWAYLNKCIIKSFKAFDITGDDRRKFKDIVALGFSRFEELSPLYVYLRDGNFEAPFAPESNEDGFMASYLGLLKDAGVVDSLLQNKDGSFSMTAGPGYATYFSLAGGLPANRKSMILLFDAMRGELMEYMSDVVIETFKGETIKSDLMVFDALTGTPTFINYVSSAEPAKNAMLAAMLEKIPEPAENKLFVARTGASATGLEDETRVQQVSVNNIFNKLAKRHILFEMDQDRHSHAIKALFMVNRKGPFPPRDIKKMILDLIEEAIRAQPGRTLQEIRTGIKEVLPAMMRDHIVDYAADFGYSEAFIKEMGCNISSGFSSSAGLDILLRPLLRSECLIGEGGLPVTKFQEKIFGTTEGTLDDAVRDSLVRDLDEMHPAALRCRKTTEQLRKYTGWDIDDALAKNYKSSQGYSMSMSP